MSLDLENFLIEMNFTKNEIEDMKTMAPLLDVTTLNEVKEIIKTLEFYGFPKEDMPELFYQNPSIMIMDENALALGLKKLIKKNIDIEEHLKYKSYDI